LCPHDPQLSGSKSVGVQTPPQHVPPTHAVLSATVTQAPLLQAWQALQAPQLIVPPQPSLWVPQVAPN
jgi:hypothetical protein